VLAQLVQYKPIRGEIPGLRLSAKVGDTVSISTAADNASRKNFLCVAGHYSFVFDNTNQQTVRM
jgi:hypothetical protein